MKHFLQYQLLLSILLILISLPVINNAIGQGLWVRKSDFPGSERHGAIGFSIGSKGYIINIHFANE